MRNGKFRAGDLVMLRPELEILATLDADGKHDGLPFMPEMLAWRGKTFQVTRRVEKTCMEVDGHYPTRRFANQDVVVLDGPRCDGSAHDGCDRGCRIYWKEAWLRPAIDERGSPPDSAGALAQLSARLKTRADETRYSCQSTELFKATVEFPGKKKPWLVRIAFREILNRDLAVWRVAQLFLRWIRYRVPRHFQGDSSLRGPNTRTPLEVLDLQPGEVVCVKSRARIAETLDAIGRNRGMGICEEMTRLSGQRVEVRRRVNRIIEEKTGRMRPMQHTVQLRDLPGAPVGCDECLCHSEMGDCPRGDLMYWREIWLERSQDSRAPQGSQRLE